MKPREGKELLAQMYVCEQPDHTFIVYNKEENVIAYTANDLHSAVDFCYYAGFNFEVEIMEQILLGFEQAQKEE